MGSDRMFEHEDEARRNYEPLKRQMEKVVEFMTLKKVQARKISETEVRSSDMSARHERIAAEAVRDLISAFEKETGIELDVEQFLMPEEIRFYMIPHEVIESLIPDYDEANRLCKLEGWTSPYDDEAEAWICSYVRTVGYRSMKGLIVVILAGNGMWRRVLGGEQTVEDIEIDRQARAAGWEAQ